MLARLRSWLASLLRRDRFERGLSDELRFHIETHADDLKRTGLSDEEALRRARLEFGSVEHTKDECRHAVGVRFIDELGQDVRYAARQFGRRPVFALITVLTLALAVGPTAVIFGWARVILNPLPIANTDDIVFVWGLDRQRGSTQLQTSVPDYLHWREYSRTFDELAALDFGTSNVTDLGEPMRVSVVRVSANLFAAWQIAPASGRPFAPADNQPGRPRVALLSDRFWQQHYGGNSDVLGRTMMLDGQAVEIVGILPPALETKLFRGFELWVPLSLDLDPTTRNRRALMVVGRLNPEATLEGTRAEMARITEELATDYPETNAGLEARVVRAADALGPSSRAVVGLLGLSVAFLVLIACANVTNLMFAHGVTREKELTIRTALGASRVRLVRQLIVESVLLAVLAGGIGVVLAMWSLRLLIAALGGGPLISDLAVDGSVLRSTALLVLVMPVIFALGPALRASRTEVTAGLRVGGGGPGSTRRWISKRDLLVVSQVTMAVSLLILVAQITRTGLALRAIEPGFESRNLMTVRFELPDYKYAEANDRRAFAERLVEAIEGLPGVAAVGVTDHLPIADRETTYALTLEGAMADPSSAPRAALTFVSPGYLSTLGVPLLTGRALRDSDREGSPSVAVVSQAMASRHWPGESPVGRRIRLGPPNTAGEWVQIVGIVGNVRNSDADAPLLSQVYQPLARQPARRLALIVRTGLEPSRLADGIRREVANIDAAQPIYDLRTMDQVIAADTNTTMVMTAVFAILGLIAVTLTAAGLHGVLWYLVTQRTREIGIRMALGATPGTLRTMVIRHGASLVAAGLVLGLLAGYALARLISSGTLGEIWAPQVIGFVIVPAFVATVALAVSHVSATRATKVDPLVALRAE